jgi:predicted membrane-bound mannosyltransferase
MKKKLVPIMTLALGITLAACGNSANSVDSSADVSAPETPAASETATIETEKTETPAASETTASETEAPVQEAAAGSEVEVGGPYPANTAWDEYVVTEYYFEETDEDVTMTIQTNTAHDTFDMQFDFFGDKQQITFHSDNTVDYDLSGFMTKDVEKLNAFVAEITDWAPIE